jgi:hypothetical protein
MTASALAAIATFEVISSRENDKPFGCVVIIVIG